MTVETIGIVSAYQHSVEPGLRYRLLADDRVQWWDHMDQKWRPSMMVDRACLLYWAQTGQILQLNCIPLEYLDG